MSYFITLLLDKRPLRLTKQGREQGPGAGIVCRCSSFLQLYGFLLHTSQGQWVRALFLDRWQCGQDVGKMQGREGKAWVFDVIEEVRGGEIG